ncbi:S9 family peptidase [Deinococcus multiflagellatus]|nr:alpha/beta fold hydrolase [Deinococcus multiflagellatus]MBZ9712343.1 alpha/beta fold hydrolase [Deinococcus multiflagellatus]
MPTPLPLEELAALPTILGLVVSPDGEQVAFYADWTGRFELYTLHLGTREQRQHTNGELPRTPRTVPVWGADSARLFFARDEGGDERTALFELPLAGGAVRPLFHAPGSMDYPVQAHPNGAHLLVNSTRGGQLNVWRYDLRAEGEAAWTPLTQLPNTTQAVAYSPDGTRISLNTNESPNLRNLDAYVLDEGAASPRRVWQVREGSRDSAGHWHPQGEQLAVSSDADGHSRAGILTLGSGEVRWLTPADGQTEETPGHFSPDGQWLLVTRSEHSAALPVLYATAGGEARTLHLPPGLTVGGQFALGGRALLLRHTTTTTRPDTLLYDLETDTFEVLMAAGHGTLDPAHFTPGQYIHYPTTDGLEVPAILYTPQGLSPQGRHPALICAHGGPTAQFFRAFDAEVQYLASLGYTVLCPNVRGSTGYGVAWRDANLKDWGGRDLADIAAGAQYLRGLPHVDPARIGLFGVSYGGYLSYLAPVKYPDLFKVSVPIVGITDLHQLHADNSRDMPQLGYYFRTMMGDPVEDAELWRDRSAVTHAHALKAHLFMMHGANDPRCPVNQARGFRDALLATGKQEGQDFEYIEFADQGHGTADIEGKTRSYRLLADYLRRRL